MRLGIDVGGTHTDAVIMTGSEILGRHKALTTPDIIGGIVEALTAVLRQSDCKATSIESVMIGTTQFTNAVVARRGLHRTLAARISLPGGSAVPPLSGWPRDLAEAVDGGSEFLHGGLEYDGREFCAMDDQEIAALVTKLQNDGTRQVAITSPFSPLTPDHEERLAAAIREAIPDADITCSHEIGGLGLLDRENAAILNASLSPLASHVVTALDAAVRKVGISAPVFISQNDGTLMNAGTARHFPVITFSSGPTNSMRGALCLSGVKDAIVADVGGTTTDIGMLSDGFPRLSGAEVKIGGVRTNFRMPDVLPIGLGGGSLVRDDGARIGPDSVGHDLVTQGMTFGGDLMTASDIGIAAGLARFGDPSLIRIEESVVKTALSTIRTMLAEAIDQVKTSADPLPLIAVGGGAFLVPDDIPGITEVIMPPHSAVANAVGAALAQVGGEAELIYSRSGENRREAHDRVKQQARDKAISMGAVEGTVQIISIEETRLAYMADDSVRLKAKAVGDLRVT
ncbi:MAG: hydantoinase/oxoprolinase family protein [Gammaproteobacteria bacterium]|nr:hydantoinase/oxoprolinase family protein [Gammaproteobacteria bacterium]